MHWVKCINCIILCTVDLCKKPFSVKNGVVKQSRIIPESEYMMRSATTRSDNRM